MGAPLTGTRVSEGSEDSVGAADTARWTDVSVATQSRDPTSPKVQTTVLGQLAQFIDEPMKIPVVQHRTSLPQCSEDVQ